MIRGPISLVIVGSISVFMFVLVSLGPQAFERFLPEPVMAMLEGEGMMQTVGGGGGMFSSDGGIFSSGGKTSGKSPSDLLVDGKKGLVARGAIAALAGNRPVFIDDVIDGHVTRVAKAIPAEVMTIRPVTGCRLTPPGEGTLVGHVTAGSSELELPFLTYGDANLAEAVQVFVNSYREFGSGKVQSGSGVAYEAYDVAITETARPVYLVLVNMYGHRIWNLHLAPGARVERVVLLGGNHAGVANLDPVVPVEVISATGLAECGVIPAYSRNSDEPAPAVLNDGSGATSEEAEARIAQTQDRIAAWNTWFRDSFGIIADETRAGFDAGMVSVVGPMPADGQPKAVYAPIEGAQIRMTQGQYFEIRGQSPPSETFAGRVEAIATRFAFGDLKFLRQGVSF